MRLRFEFTRKGVGRLAGVARSQEMWGVPPLPIARTQAVWFLELAAVGGGKPFIPCRLRLKYCF